MLIADNLGAHISQAVMEKCREHNIRLALQYRYLSGNRTIDTVDFLFEFS